MLSDDLRRLGWGSGREAQKGGDIFIHTAELFCCTAEMSTTQHCKAIIKKQKRKELQTVCYAGGFHMPYVVGFFWNPARWLCALFLIYM